MQWFANLKPIFYLQLNIKNIWDVRHITILWKILANFVFGSNIFKKKESINKVMFTIVYHSLVF